jgi:hypothetical protein
MVGDHVRGHAALLRDLAMTRRPTVKMLVAIGAALSVVLAGAFAAWFLFARQSSDAERFARPGRPRSSPSGAFMASLAAGPEQNGVATWVVTIADASGAEVFRDDHAYSARHGLGVTWLSSRDQLWILSFDVGDAYVQQRDDGRSWVKVMLTPGNQDTPEEIARLVHRGSR